MMGIPRDYARNQDKSIYVDAAYCDTRFKYAIGFAICDPGGKLLAAGHRSIQPPGSVMAAELQAISDGINYGLKTLNGTSKILSDSVEAISVVKRNHRYKGVEELIIKRVKAQSMDPLVKGIWYCTRKDNKVA